MSTQLFDPRKTKKLSLPSYPEVDIDFYEDLQAYQIEKLQEIDSDYKRGIEIIRLLIKKWSFVGENNKPVEITHENIGSLPLKDFSVLMDEATKVMSLVDVKKKKNSRK